MKATVLGLFALTAPGALLAIACGGAVDDDASASAAAASRAESGFEYECTAPASRTLIEAEKTKILITEGHFRFEGDYGPNLGTFDAKYRSPRGTSRVRFDGFETGMDCTMKVVADKALLEGKPDGKMRLQCAGDDFQQDVLSCSRPTPATFIPADPKPAEPTGGDTTPPASTKTWDCDVTGDQSALEDKLTMQVVDDSIRVVSDEDEYTGTRDRNYRPRSGNWISFEDFEYGGDCTLTLVVDPNALVASTLSTTLKVRCSGDDVVEGVYACKPK